MKLTKFIIEAYQVKWFTDKYNQKMSGSSLETTLDWIDGIGEIKDKEKAKILKNVIGKVDMSWEKKKGRLKAIISRAPKWAKPILKSVE